MEYFRLDDSGRLNDTQERLTSRGYRRRRLDNNPFSGFQSWFGRPDGPSGFGFSDGQSGPFFERPRTAEDGSGDRRLAEPSQRPPRAEPRRATPGRPSGLLNDI